MISLYLQGDSWAHRLRAGWKLLAVALASLVLFQVVSVWAYLASLAAVILCYASLGREGLAQLKLLRSLSFVLVLLLALHWLSGTLNDGVVIVLRLVVMILAANFVSITTRLDDMLEAVQPLFRPLGVLGVSPRKPALGVALVLRFAPHMLLVYGLLREAWQARTGSRNSWRLLAPFAIQSLRMSDNVAEALKARGGSEGLSR
ncbi:energy-coupling factor transporter transmembrane component T family protein [Roseibium sediminicola]|uniref:Energy-coupling factor transporter transmembrane protein EcfT n=1 Tax=Roseibium sediminicola TaxID=2933272 RepID=A0ABT0H1U5_9HYPH|nr:energy-coupling factor transporter transmembrane protein EcfT [Roseibium sp. CAU 1639]MCK7615644.1 energy-coupling factor transporter transmembrane protein EcfT [Roseibium sp. CAU 1639]